MSNDMLGVVLWCCVAVSLVSGCARRVKDDTDKPDKPDMPDMERALPGYTKGFTAPRLYPGMAGFPNVSTLKTLSFEIDNIIQFPSTEWYRYVTNSYNLRVTRMPYMSVMVRNVQDVQRAILFARKYNMMVSIQSTGHSFIGRSTYDGSLQINFRIMKGYFINLNSKRTPAGEITVESGLTWIEVYRIVDGIRHADDSGELRGRVIVGGSAKTVGMGGYTQGGGHSPICRSLGLAVDNLVEVSMVLPDGRFAHVSEEGTEITDLNGDTTKDTDNSLFWAIRGGGGGVWGAIASFTFKLHYAPKRVRAVFAQWTLKELDDHSFGRNTIKHVLTKMNQACPQWGGYILVNDEPLEVPEHPLGHYHGVLTLYMNHFGSDEDECNSDIDEIMSYNYYQNMFSFSDIKYDTFAKYAETAYDPPVTNTYIVNSFIQPKNIENENDLDKLVDFLINLDYEYGSSCTGALIGGAMRTPPSATPVNPAFRNGFLSLTCANSWNFMYTNDSTYVTKALELGHKLAEIGEGVYYNEPAQHLRNWKELFWGSMATYRRLAEIKQRYDPENFLWCHNCVGSDFKPCHMSGGMKRKDLPWDNRMHTWNRHVRLC